VTVECIGTGLQNPIAEAQAELSENTVDAKSKQKVAQQVKSGVSDQFYADGSTPKINIRPGVMLTRFTSQTFSVRVRLDRDHGFQSIVIINSRAS
jgi:hypothetical protein